MAAPLQPGDMAADLINTVFRTDVKISLEKPVKEGTEVIVERGKILEIAQKKITFGNLTEFKERQNSLARSVLDVADRLEGVAPMHNGEKEAIDKIYHAAVVKIGEDPGKKKALIKDLKIYADQLLQATLHRRGELKSGMGMIDTEVFWHLGTTESQIRHHMQGQWQDLLPLNSLALDIERYALKNEQVTVIGKNGQQIHLDKTNGLYGYVDSLLEAAMIELGMTVKGEGALNEEASAIKAKFQALVKKEAGDKMAVSEISSDRLREAIGQLVRELKTSADPNHRKLAFVLFSLNQCWIVQTGSKLSQIAREAYGKERFKYSAQASVNELTKIKITFDKEGGILLEATGGHTNKDYKEAGSDYTAQLTTVAEMSPEGSEQLGIALKLEMEVKEDKIDSRPIQKFVTSLMMAGLRPTITPI